MKNVDWANGMPLMVGPIQIGHAEPSPETIGYWDGIRRPFGVPPSRRPLRNPPNRTHEAHAPRRSPTGRKGSARERRRRHKPRRSAGSIPAGGTATKQPLEEGK